MHEVRGVVAREVKARGRPAIGMGDTHRKAVPIGGMPVDALMRDVEVLTVAVGPAGVCDTSEL